MNFLDRLIGLFSPSWALDRVAARDAMRAFDAAKIQRENARPPAKNFGPLGETQLGREKLLLVARDLDRNNGWASGVFNAIVDNIVGDGIVPEIRIRGPRGGLRESLNARIEELWERWAEGVDLNRQMSFYDLEAQVERELWVSGEVLIVLSQRPDPEPGEVPLVLDLVESERLADLTEERASGKIVQGIEFDAKGRRVAYHIYDEHPGDSGMADAKRIPAERVLHIFRPRRVGAIRGYSRLHPVANTFAALAQYLDYELTRARITASWALLWKRNRPGMRLPQPPGAAERDEGQNYLSYQYGGMILQGGPQDELQSASPAFGNTAFETFVAVMLRKVAVGLNVSYEVLSRDFTKTNFSSSRSSSLEDRKHWRPRQKFLIRRCGTPILREFLRQAALSVGDEFLRGIKIESVPVQWRVPGWEWVDPVKEVNAEEQACGNGFTSPQRVCASHGNDFFAVVDEIAEAREYAEERKVKLAFLEPEKSKAAVGGNNGDQEQDQDSDSDESKRAGRGSPPRPRALSLPS